jgi:hypothetical protein
MGELFEDEGGEGSRADPELQHPKLPGGGVRDPSEKGSMEVAIGRHRGSGGAVVGRRLAVEFTTERGALPGRHHRTGHRREKIGLGFVSRSAERRG